MKVLCALNPTSASGMAMERWPQIEAHLRGFGMAYELLAEKSVPLSAQLLQRMAHAPEGEFGAIVGIGGDGTQSSLINALMNFRRDHAGYTLPPYALLPLGTGNNIAKSFGLNSREDFFVSDLRRAVSTIRHGADYQLDLGLLRGMYFADAFTIGLDSRILHERNAHLRRIERIPIVRNIFRGNYLLYTWSLSRVVWKAKTRHVDIEIDGAPWYSGPILNLVVNNTRIYGGEFDFTPDAYANDGLLDVVIFTGQVDYLLRYALSLRGNPDRVRRVSATLASLSSHKQGRRIVIRADKAVAAQVDGEELAANDRFEIDTVPNAIHIKTPAEP